MPSVHMVFFYLMMARIIPCNFGLHSGSSNKHLDSAQGDNNTTTASTLNSKQAHLSHRKLLVDETCTERDISISQGEDSTSGIPQFVVEIVNTCVSDCAPSDIHLHCGSFASANLVNPEIFQRLAIDDCLVNAGKPLMTSQGLITVLPLIEEVRNLESGTQFRSLATVAELEPPRANTHELEFDTELLFDEWTIFTKNDEKTRENNIWVLKIIANRNYPFEGIEKEGEKIWKKVKENVAYMKTGEVKQRNAEVKMYFPLRLG